MVSYAIYGAKTSKAVVPPPSTRVPGLPFFPKEIPAPRLRRLPFKI